MVRNPDPPPNDLTASLVELGFNHKPFGFHQAERIPPDVLEVIFVAPENFDEYMTDFEQSAVLIAPSGGGKTASRRRLEQFLTRDSWGSPNVPPRFLTVLHTNFEKIVGANPGKEQEVHKRYLLGAIATAILAHIRAHEDGFLALDRVTRSWWWMYLREYREGEELELQVEAKPRLLEDLRLLPLRKAAPLNAQGTLYEVLQRLEPRIRNLGFDRMFILVDDIDGFVGSELFWLHSFAKPLFDAIPLFNFPTITWKFFLPPSLSQIVQTSPSYHSGRIQQVSIAWEEESLFELLSLSLKWASDNTIHDLTQLCDQNLVIEVDDINRQLIKMALRHPRFGPARALLVLANNLLNSHRDSSSPLISPESWHRFLDRTQPTLVSKAPSAQTAVHSITPAKLRKVLTARFNGADIKILCFDLSISYEALAGVELRERIISLIEYAVSRRRFKELVDGACELRPDIIDELLS